MLTRKQHELLLFIHNCIKQKGIPPSFDEMKKALDLSSKSGIHRLITGLEERGFVRRLPNRARAIEIIRPPASIIQNPDVSSAVEGEYNHPPLNTGKITHIPVPLMGKITASIPVSEIQNQTGQLSLPENMIATGEYYALEMKDNSMSAAGILDGDTVIILRTNTATSGEIIVAVIDDTEAMLKRYRFRGSSVALESANPAYATRISEMKHVKIQGRLSSLIRRY